MINKNEDMRNSTKEEVKNDMEKFEYKIENDEKQFIIKSEDSSEYGSQTPGQYGLFAHLFRQIRARSCG